jgi:hypothetical protein
MLWASTTHALATVEILNGFRFELLADALGLGDVCPLPCVVGRLSE